MPDTLKHWVMDRLGLPAEASVDAEALTAEASFRSFFRVSSDRRPGERYILMDSPPDKENNAAFQRLAAVLGEAGLPVPRVLASNDDEGWFLLSDLGNRDLETAYADGAVELALREATAALLRLQTVESEAIAPYTETRFRNELTIFSDYFLGRLLDMAPPNALEAVFELLVERTQQQPQCCVHRDYHCRNLLLDSNGHFGIVDFQDALVGPFSYDLASLLRDCYHEFPEREVRAWSRRYLTGRENITGERYDEKTFAIDLDFCAVQRQLKAIGIFARLKLRDGKTSHLRYISPLAQRLIALSESYEALAPVAACLREALQKEAAWQA